MICMIKMISCCYIFLPTYRYIFRIRRRERAAGYASHRQRAQDSFRQNIFTHKKHLPMKH